MSDPVTNVEIEDVLSSIRKLVSDDGRTPANSVPVEPSRPKANKLVLTPALRVSEPEPDQAAVEAPDLEPAPDDAAADKATDDATPEVAATETPWRNPDTTLFEVDSASRTDAEETDRQPERPMLLRPEDAVHAPHGITVVADEEEQQEEEKPACADQFSFRGGQFARDGVAEQQSLSKKIEALEAAIGRTEDRWEPDGTTDEEYSGTKVEVSAWQDEPEADPLTSEDPIEESSGDADALEPDTESETAQIQAAEAMPDTDTADDEGTRFDEEFAGPVDDAMDGELLNDTPLNAETVPPSDLDPEPEEASQYDLGPADEPVDETGNAEDVAAFDHDPVSQDWDDDLMAESEAVLDEDSLRELVSEIVRQELQGALGERITRNVRKLVRREINRALSARELS